MAIGIDLGTVYTRACVYDESSKIGNFHLIENMSERRLLNYINFKDNKINIGSVCKQNLNASNIGNTIFDTKILLGACFDEKFEREIFYKTRWPFKISRESKNRLNVSFCDSSVSSQMSKSISNLYTPEELSAIFLTKFKQLATTKLNKEIVDAVITVPACFNDSQRQATMDAGKIAGLNVLRLISDSTAAAIAISHEKNYSSKKNILIFDLGGYFLNLTIASIDYGEITAKSVLSIPELGGIMFDYRLLTCLLLRYKTKQVDLSSNKYAIQILLNHCEKLKNSLIGAEETFVDVEPIGGTEELRIRFERELFEQLNTDLFAKIMFYVEKVVSLSNLNPNQIDEIFLLGGCSRMPKIKSMLREFFPNKELNFSMNAYETVAYGAAIQAAFLSGKKLKNNNGFRYTELSCYNYILTVVVNQKSELKLYLDAESPVNVYKSVNCECLEDRYHLSINLYENYIKIFNLDMKTLFGTKGFEISLDRDINGIISIRLVLLENYNYRQNFELNCPKQNCLGTDKINSIIQLRNQRLEDEKKNSKKLEQRKKYEHQIRHLRNKLDKIEYPFIFNANRLDKKLDECLTLIKVKGLDEYELIEERLKFFDDEIKKLIQQVNERKEVEEKCLKIKSKLNVLNERNNETVKSYVKLIDSILFTNEKNFDDISSFLIKLEKQIDEI